MPDLTSPAILAFVIVAVMLFLMIFVGIFLFNKDAEKIKFSITMIQTIIGFYVGVISGILGLPSH